MMELIRQIRLVICETMLGWIISIAPKDCEEGVKIITAIHDYLNEAVKDYIQKYPAIIKGLSHTITFKDEE